jgi:D-3-phosphoglycerate dehydrogenase
MKVLAYDPFLDTEAAKSVDAEPCTFSDLCRRSDFISLHVPLNDQTRNLVNAAAIAGMKHGAIIMNTSRGGLIDENAAYDALTTGRLGGLGLDAFDHEPPKGSKLLMLDTVVATPHAGAHTAEAIQQMGMLSAQNLIDVLSGNDCRYVVNKEYFSPNPLHG